jgi:hypothetical protein
MTKPTRAPRPTLRPITPATLRQVDGAGSGATGPVDHGNGEDDGFNGSGARRT